LGAFKYSDELNIFSVFQGLRVPVVALVV